MYGTLIYIEIIQICDIICLRGIREEARNMEKVYAFTDESGAFGWEIENPSVSTHFIITAIIVKESDLADFAQKSEILRKNTSKRARSNPVKLEKSTPDVYAFLLISKIFPSIFFLCASIKNYVLKTWVLEGSNIKKLL